MLLSQINHLISRIFIDGMVDESNTFMNFTACNGTSVKVAFNLNFKMQYQIYHLIQNTTHTKSSIDKFKSYA